MLAGAFGPIPEPTSILVVEDDDVLRSTLVEALSVVTSRVREVSRLADATAAITTEEPDLVVLDLGLPDGDGADLLTALRRVTSVPVIVLSGREDDDEKVALLDAGADDFITKPCSAAELVARVRGQLRRSITSRASRNWSQISVDGVEIDLMAQRVTPWCSAEIDADRVVAAPRPSPPSRSAYHPSATLGHGLVSRVR